MVDQGQFLPLHHHHHLPDQAHLRNRTAREGDKIIVEENNKEEEVVQEIRAKRE